LDTQEPDGSWHVHTRLHSKLQISPPFFETGFPHGRDQFISTVGTAWAAMGLLEMLPRVPNAPKALPVSEAKPRDLEPWLQTASFGTAAELKQLLEAGLSPNVKTKSGLTVLMAAAPDTTKLRLLLDNGADVNLKSGGGDTALSIAATYRNGYDAVRLLLEHGAAAGDVDKLITAASMGGDTKTMSLLLNRFKPQSIPGRALLEAVGWDNVGMVRVLAKAGADVNTRHEHQQMTALIRPH
jgi:ankyrin repeat protein